MRDWNRMYDTDHATRLSRDDYLAEAQRLYGSMNTARFDQYVTEWRQGPGRRSLFEFTRST